MTIMTRFALFLLLLATPLFAQKKQLTLEAIYHPTQKVAFAGAIQDDFEWIDDDSFLGPREDERGNFVEWRVYDVTTGKERALFDRTKLQNALVEAGLDAGAALSAAESDARELSRKNYAFVVAAAHDKWR